MAKTKITPTPTQSVINQLKENKNIVLGLVVAFIAIALFYGRGLFVVALVNGRPVMRYDVIAELESQAGQSTTDALISEILIQQKAKEAGVTIPQEDVDAKIGEIEADLSTSGQSLDDLLELQGLTRADVEEQIKLQLMLRELLTDKITVTDAEVDEAVEQQAESKPEEMSDEDFRAQIKTTLEEQQFSFEAQSYVQDLLSTADIQYWHTY